MASWDFPSAIKLLADSEHVRGLNVLDLSHNPIGEAGARALAESPHLEGLVELVLRGCDVGAVKRLRDHFGDRVLLDTLSKCSREIPVARIQ